MNAAKKRTYFTAEKERNRLDPCEAMQFSE